MTQEQLNNTQTSERINKTVSLEVPTHDIDDFDKALDNEKARTAKATAAAEYNRKKYADAKDIIGEKEARIAELEQAMERKNGEIARLRRLDRNARETEVQANTQEVGIFNLVAERMLNKRA
jgi:small-conductance mechanosensitive channel